MLNQQCWLWGQDVCRTEGNLLLQHGFSRLRPPTGRSGSSQYTLQLDADRFVRLWGFGLFYGGEEGIFLNRFRFVPRKMQLVRDEWQAHTRDELPVCDDPELLTALLRWISHYESWVISVAGLNYRHRCMRGWKVRSVSCDQLSTRWRQLAEEVEAFSRSSDAPSLSPMPEFSATESLPGPAQY